MANKFVTKAEATSLALSVYLAGRPDLVNQILGIIGTGDYVIKGIEPDDPAPSPADGNIFQGPSGTYTNLGGVVISGNGGGFLLRSYLDEDVWIGIDYDIDLLNYLNKDDIEYSLGKNKFNINSSLLPAGVGKAISTGDGSIINISGYNLSYRVDISEVVDGGDITFSGLSDKARGIRFENDAQALISFAVSEDFPFTTIKPVGSTHVIFSLKTPDDIENPPQTQIEFAGFATSFEAYQEKIVKINGFEIVASPQSESNSNVLKFAENSHPTFELVSNPDNNFTVDYDPDTTLLKVRAIIPGSGGIFVAAVSTEETTECIINWGNPPSIVKNWVVVGKTGTSAYIADVANSPSTVLRINPDGSVSSIGNPTTTGGLPVNGDRVKIKFNETNIEIYDFNGEIYFLWTTIPRSYGIAESYCGAASGDANTFANTFDAFILPSLVYSGADTVMGLDSIDESDLDLLNDDVFLTTPFTTSKVKRTKLIDFLNTSAIKGKYIGKRIYLYGDSISSTDYPWYGEYMLSKTGASVVKVGGKSGRNAAQLTDNTFLNDIVSFKADLIIFMPCGNDNGVVGTVGTFNPNTIGETVVSDPVVSAPYNGTKFISAIAYIVQYLNSKYYDFKNGHTPPYTDVIKPKLVLLTGLPQKRNFENPSDWGNPLNHERKANAIKEVATRFHVPVWDSLTNCYLDMALEPEWTPPTNVNDDNGIRTMDGLHLNKYGYDFFTDGLVGFINNI